MNWRLFTTALVGMLFALLNAGLLWEEHICETDMPTKAEQRANDPLFSLAWAATSRERNLQAMGFEPDEVKEILQKIGLLEQRYHTTDKDRNLIAIRIDAVTDADELITALCGTGSVLPVRYSAMPFLVGVKDGRRRAIDLEEVSSLTFQDWGKGAPLQAIYETADLPADRQPDTPRMLFAAVLEHQEALVLDRREPWGRGLFSGWSWSAVQKQFPGVRTRVEDYVALMHLVLETARAERGVCATGEESRGL
jgi:hypothetical protein